MRSFLVFAFLLVASLLLAGNVISPSTETLLDGTANYNQVQPGDTVFLEHGTRPYLILKNFRGTAQKPIVFINFQGKVSITGSIGYGISVQNCQFFVLTGEGDSGIEYGIYANITNGSALGVGVGSSDFEVKYVEGVSGKGPGFLIKTDPSCDLKYTREKFSMDNVSIHHNYVHHTDTEGLYFGSTFYTGFNIKCGGKDTLVMPHLSTNVRIFENRFEHTGWDGLQVSSTMDAEVFSNSILYDSQLKTASQMNGLIIGNGTSGRVYNNLVAFGEGTGIICFTDKQLSLFNNIVVEPGFSNNIIDGRYGIYLDRKRVAEQPKKCVVANNLVVSAKTEAIRFVGDNENAKDSIVNNLVVLPNQTGQLSEAYINVNDTKVALTSNRQIAASDFAIYCNVKGLNFEICNEKEAFINQGSAVGEIARFSDYLGGQRAFGKAIDIGPVEWQTETLVEDTLEELVRISLFNDGLTIQSPELIQSVYVYQLNGGLVISESPAFGVNQVHVSLNQISGQVVLLKVILRDGQSIVKRLFYPRQ